MNNRLQTASKAATVKANKVAAAAEATRQINAMAAGGATASQIQDVIAANKSTFLDAGLTLKSLNEEAYRASQDQHARNHGYQPI